MRQQEHHALKKSCRQVFAYFAGCNRFLRIALFQKRSTSQEEPMPVPGGNARTVRLVRRFTPRVRGTRREVLGIATVAIILTLLSFSIGCGLLGQGISPPPNIKPQEPNVVSLDPSNWYIYYSAGTPAHPSTDAEGPWSFEFPGSESGGHENYVQTPFNATTTPHNLSVTFKIESDAPQYEVLDTSDILPATVHLYYRAVR